MPKRKSDTIRAAVRERVAALDLNPFALAERLDGAVSDDSIRRYLAGTHDLTSGKLDALFRVLGLAVSVPAG